MLLPREDKIVATSSAAKPWRASGKYLAQAKIFVQQDTGMQLVEGQVLAPAPHGLPTALAHTAFHPAFGLLVGPRDRSTSSDSFVSPWQALWVQQGFPGLRRGEDALSEWAR